MKQVKCNVTFGESILFLLGWFLLAIITFGLATPFFILSFSKYIINRSTVVDNGTERRMTSTLSIGSDTLYLIGWTILTLITFGIAGIFFIFSLAKRVMNSIEIE